MTTGAVIGAVIMVVVLWWALPGDLPTRHGAGPKDDGAATGSPHD
jgi:hypothetical protein